jgi:hypothetical protein
MAMYDIGGLNYEGHSEETHLLRATSEGQELIRLYYQLNPVIVELIKEEGVLLEKK